MKELSIKVSIAGRIYPLSVQQNEEENIRKAVKAIEEMVKEYEQNYAVKDRQDLLAMVALQYATKVMEMTNNAEVIDKSYHNKLQVLNEMISEVL